MRVHGITLTISALLMLLSLLSWASGCGGEVHFVDGRPVIRVQPPIARPTRHAEKFLFSRSSGSQSIAIVVHPRKSLRAARARLVDQIPVFVRSLLEPTPGAAIAYRELQVTVVQEGSVYASVNWYSPSSAGLPRERWAEEVIRHLQESLAKMPLEPGPGSAPAGSPFEALERIAQSASGRLREANGPAWLNYFYLRDSDLIPGVETDDALASSIETFKRAAHRGELSKFRVGIEQLSYLSAGGECDPFESWIAGRLRTALSSAGVGFAARELCGLLSQDGLQPARLMRAWADAAHDRDSRVILARQPDEATLRLKIGGVEAAREDFNLEAGRNEIVFREGIAPRPRIGQEIEVSFEEAGK